MKPLSQANSIRQKLTRILLSSTLTSLLIAGILVTAMDFVRQYHAIEEDLETQASVLALTTQAALSFQDARAGAENLASLQGKPNVEGAALYDISGKPFATYSAPRSPYDVPRTAPAPGTDWDPRLVATTRVVTARQERVGYLYIATRHEFASRLAQYLGALALIILASLGAGYFLAGRLQRSVTEPIIEISQVARMVLNGDARPVRATRKSQDEVGELVDAFNAMLDELARREVRLQESNRAKDRFIATLAHELRNPLAPIRTGLQILQRDRLNGPASQKAREMMERQLAHMVHLIDDLLDISRLNTGKFALSVAETPVMPLLRSAIESCAGRIEAAGQQLRVHEPPRGLLIHADPVRMTQVLGNLVGNASKYTPEGGRIDIHLKAAGPMVEIVIRDSGIGIPPESLGQVFELFAQVHTQEDKLHGGLGIGLFIVRNVIEMHGGTVEVTSDGLGKGSQFTIRVPGRELPAAAPEATAPGTSADRSTSARRLLVVDDNVDAANALGMMLQLQGHEVHIAHDGPAALALQAECGPEVVVLDIGMPGMNGYEIARRIRADTQLPQPVLVALTGWGTEADRQSAHEAGFDHHLTKPADMEALEALIRSA